MKRLSEILENVPFEGVVEDAIQITGLTADSREVKPGMLFIAVKGHTVDGHKYINKAIENGAAAVVSEHEIETEKAIIVKVSDSRKSLAKIAESYYDSPSSKFHLIGITGTNGKTSVASLLFQLCRNEGMNCGLISTIKYQINEVEYASKFTTPDAIKLQSLMDEMAKAKCELVFMEVSSHAIDQGRIDELEFDGALFTNITHDHLDYHGTFRHYIDTKKKFFDNLDRDAIAIVNSDDKHGEYMLQNTKAKSKSFALKRLADYKGKVLSNDLFGLQMKINEQEVFLKLTGLFNAYNMLAVYALANELELIEKSKLLSGITALRPIEGRMDVVAIQSRNALGVVDYAHTPDALKNVLSSIAEFKRKKVITIIGCGGDRDRAKRPKMAKIAIQLSDLVIITSDNPRSEDPEFILDEMEEGLSKEEKQKLIRITDREQAIKTGIQFLAEQDILLVAGKGHEKYQEINGIKMPFDDKEKIAAFS